MADPTSAPFVMSAIPNMIVCGTDYCSTPPSAAAGAASVRVALLVGALAALATLL